MEEISILFVGDSSYEMYVKAFYEAAKKLDNVKAKLIDFGKLNTSSSKDNLALRFERHYRIGPHVLLVNNEIIKYVKNNRVDIVFLYACDIINASVVKKLSQLTYVAVYNNDNPFSSYYSKYMWKKVIASLKFADIVYSYRKSNIEQYKKAGAKKVKLLRSYYIKERNYYIPDEEIELEVPDVCFIGHHEDDGRIEYIEALLKKGIDVGVPEYWEKLGIKSEHLIYIKDSHKRYNEILNKTKIAIVFLSSINEDTYTRRCFEIPVVKTLMIAPKNSDIESMFDDGKEVVLYRSKEDLCDKVIYYLNHTELRDKIALSGYARVIKDGYDVTDRVKEIISDYKSNNTNI